MRLYASFNCNSTLFSFVPVKIDSGKDAFAALVFRGTRGRLSNWLVNLDQDPPDRDIK